MKKFFHKLARVTLTALLVVFSVPTAFFYSVKTAFASTYTVASNGSSANDSNCSTSPESITLLEAVDCANAHPGPDTITIPANASMGGAITLSGGIAVSSGEDLTIIGSGSGTTSITSGGISIAGAAFSLSGVTLTPSGSPQSVISESTTFTGNFTLNDVVIDDGASIGVFLGADDGFDITGNVSITNSDISGDHAGVYIGVAGGGSPTTKMHVTGTVDISDNTFSVSPATSGSGIDAGVGFLGGDAAGAVSVNNNVFENSGAAEGSGFVAMDMSDLSTSFGSTVDITGNTMTLVGSDTLGAGVADLIRSVGLTTISGNTISGGIGQDANLAGGVLMADGGCIFGGTCVGQEDAEIADNDIDVSFEGAPGMPVILITADTNVVSANTVDINNEDAVAIACTSFSSSADCSVSDNEVAHMGGGTGIAVTPGVDAQAVSGIVYNNIVWGGDDDAGMGITAASIPLGGPQPAGATIDVSIYNNSVDGNGHTLGIAAGDMTGDTVLNAVVFNNAVANYSTSAAAGILQIGTSEDVSFAHDHNMSGPTSTNAFVSSPDGMSFDDLVLGTGDVVDDPEYTDASTGDLSIGATSPAVNAGVASSNSVNAPSLDILGHARHGSAPDIGAYDYNAAPTANAGADQDVHTGDTVSIGCTSTDPEDDDVSYQWETVSGPDTPVFPSGADQSFAASAPGTYVMQCEADDGNGGTDTDTMSVVVTDANTAPVANAGPDQYTTIGDQVDLTCAGSTDPEDDTLTYSWSQTGGSTVSLSSTTSATPHFTPSSLGTRTFQCTVNDGALTDSDTISVKVTAQRIAGADRYNTAIAIAQQLYPTSHTVSALVIASGENYPDALASGPLASLVGGPVLLVQKTWAPSEVRTEISRLWNNSDDAATDIYVIGGTSAIADSVVAQIQAVNSKLDIKRLAGTDRIDTAIKVAQEMDSVRGQSPTNVAVASGYNFNDAAAMAAAGSDSTVNSRYIPVLLNGTGSLDSRVSSYINGKKSSLSKVWAVGATSAISATAENSMKSIVGSSKVTRLSGSDKYGNTTAIASQFYPSATAVTITVGGNFPDVLAGGPYAASKHAPVLYVTSSSVPSANTTFLDAKAATLNYVYVLGGTTAIPNTVKQTVQQHL